ncbi:four helix bundle protein [Bacteroidia bacterium]|nr:four helix bundle protein [Bacteroidia bacterium]
MQNYKDLIVWEKSHNLTVVIYKMTCNFPKEETYALTSQLRRASSSIPANIAEGCGRNTNLDLAHFLNMALGSSNELDYFLLLSKDLNYITKEDFIDLEAKIGELKAMLIKLISKVRNKKT